MIKKERLQAASIETMKIIEQGGYFNLSGDWIEIGSALDQQGKGNMLYEPERVISKPSEVAGQMMVSVRDEDAVSAIIRMSAWPEPVCCLVFASARRPGGGFLNGANAQEESIVRSSTLPMSLLATTKFYESHRRSTDLLYSNAAIYTPHVQLFRNKSLTLLDQPVECAFITAAAPNASAIINKQEKDIQIIPYVFDQRLRRVLRIAAYHNHRRLVLGAWGCGVFKNDPKMVARTFYNALLDENGFDEVIFAIPKTGSDHHAIFTIALAGT